MNIFDNLKSAASVLQEAGKIEQYKQILEAQKDLLEMQETISKLKSENKELNEKLEIKEKLFFERNSYWVGENNKTMGPFCSCCWDDTKKTIRMQPCGNPALYSCPKCENKHVMIYPEKERPIHISSPGESFDPFSVF